jgi:hypothetical protein
MNIWDAVKTGLSNFGDGARLVTGFNPQGSQMPQDPLAGIRPLMGMGMALAQAGQPSLQPIGMGQAFGNALQTGQMIQLQQMQGEMMRRRREAMAADEKANADGLDKLNMGRPTGGLLNWF